MLRIGDIYVGYGKTPVRKTKWLVTISMRTKSHSFIFVTVH